MLGNHQCSLCGQGATVKFTKLFQGQMEETWLCQDCAAKKSPYQKKMTGISIQALLEGILKQQGGEAAAKPSPESEVTCRTCGLPFDSYRKSLLLGCSDCYESFDEYLQNDLRRLHGATVHRGRVPDGVPQPAGQRRPLHELRRRLKEAVAAEDFELAARLRDEIRQPEPTEEAQ